MKALRFGSIMAAAAIFGACSDSTTGPGTGTPGAESVSLSFSTNPGGAANAISPFSASMSGAFGDTLRAGNDVLIIDRAQIVLREIELKKQEVIDCDVEPDP